MKADLKFFPDSGNGRHVEIELTAENLPDIYKFESLQKTGWVQASSIHFGVLKNISLRIPYLADAVPI